MNEGEGDTVEQQNRVARKMMLPTLPVGAPVARAAYEMGRGQPVPDREQSRRNKGDTAP